MAQLSLAFPTLEVSETVSLVLDCCGRRISPLATDSAASRIERFSITDGTVSKYPEDGIFLLFTRTETLPFKEILPKPVCEFTQEVEPTCHHSSHRRRYI